MNQARTLMKVHEQACQCGDKTEDYMALNQVSWDELQAEFNKQLSMM